MAESTRLMSYGDALGSRIRQSSPEALCIMVGVRLATNSAKSSRRVASEWL